MAEQQGYQYPAIPTIQQPLQTHQPYAQAHQYVPVPVPTPHPNPYPSLQTPQIPYAQQYNPHQYAAIAVPPMPLPQIQYPLAHQPTYVQPHYSSRSRPSKRRREPIAEAEAPSTKRQAIGNDVLFRVVVPSAQIGKVIGKGGHRVQKVRDDTKATIKIADPIARYEERVIIISSKANDGSITDAEKALLLIASLILVDDGTGVQTQSANAAAVAAYSYASVGAVSDPNSVGSTAGISTGHVPANSVRLLIAGSQVGGLIGVSGENIEKLRNASGATITVLAPNQLPFCASAHESDRLIQNGISGEVPAVLKAVEDIGVELRANPPSEVISISPTYNLTIAQAAQQYMDPNAAEYVTLDMLISETMVGGLIGRGGSNIARIRSESGAMIKVFGGKGEQKNRQIQLIGTAQQVALAKQRIDEYVYSQVTQ